MADSARPFLPDEPAAPPIDARKLRAEVDGSVVKLIRALARKAAWEDHCRAMGLNDEQ